MSFGVVAAWPQLIVCASDRRLVDFGSGKRTLTNRSTKMTLFGCADAHGVIVYSGIGRDDEGLTPSDWLMELHEREKLFEADLPDVVSGISADLETRLGRFRANHGAKNARHTFLIAAWHRNVSLVYGISNYECLDKDTQSHVGNEKVTQNLLATVPDGAPRIVSTGQSLLITDRRAIEDAIQGLAVRRVTALCVNAVRNWAFGKQNARGSVGASALWAELGASRDEVWCGLDVAGGKNAQETANLINIGASSRIRESQRVRFGASFMWTGKSMVVKDAHAVSGESPAVGNYDAEKRKYEFFEPKCGICGSPLPASHRCCEECLYEKHRHEGKAARVR